MRTLEQRLSYEQLELISSPSRKGRAILTPLRTAMTWLGTHLTQAMIGQDEPHVWTHRNKQGAVNWYVRDAQTRQVEQFASEEAVRSWLEERYRF